MRKYILFLLFISIIPSVSEASFFRKKYIKPENTDIIPLERHKQYISYRRMKKTITLSTIAYKQLMEGEEYVFRYVHGRLWWNYIDDDNDVKKYHLINRVVSDEDFKLAWDNSEETEKQVPYIIWYPGWYLQHSPVMHRKIVEKNNNPFNLIYFGRAVPYIGIKGQDKQGYIIFNTKEEGIVSALKLIIGHLDKGATTLDKFFKVYSNLYTKEYKDYLQKEKLLTKEEVFSVDSQSISRLASAIASFEGETITEEVLVNLIDKYNLLDEENRKKMISWSLHFNEYSKQHQIQDLDNEKYN